MGSWERVSLSVVVTVLSLLTSSLAKKEKPGIAVYWGQNPGDGSLQDTCNSGNYKIVLMSYLKEFGCKRDPALDFDGHCGVGIRSCTRLRYEIQSCQRKGVKVLLALGGPTQSYSLCSSDDAQVIANYLYGNFLSGQEGPLGEVTLDGIHFDIQIGSDSYWDDLVNELQSIRHDNKNKFYLSAAPKCFLPDLYLDKAIKTGYFDYIFVEFYGIKTCQYSGGEAPELLKYWMAWTGYVEDYDTSLFLGLPAADEEGYVPPQNLIDDVLPYIIQTPSYGGIVLRDRAYDLITKYSKTVKPFIAQPSKQWPVSLRSPFSVPI
ncbi:unnamed protein product [Sphenostylis stenocarpa]|uniref:GH18 domain-containing protein n=1 Tax=Sphenostylis stenocarpa TaxID=92480 RepID=A0AA86W216_9FABA|nr:unnamed protein product [Sphenostylis stenocarpa]CAJ1976978.1 unnamed protein product [Sphenostylis stenocarpa]